MLPLCHNVGKIEGVRQTGRATMTIPIPISLFIVGVACYIIFDISTSSAGGWCGCGYSI